MTTAQSFKLSKRIYREEAIQSALDAFKDHISNPTIEDEAQNFILNIQIHNVATPPQVVAGKLLNYVLEESVELNLRPV